MKRTTLAPTLGLALAALLLAGPVLADAQLPNPDFVRAEALAGQVAASTLPDDVKAGIGSRFAGLAAQQKSLWELAGQVDSGACTDACQEGYNSQVDAWMAALQAFNQEVEGLVTQGSAQVTMENRSDGALDLYIDGEYQCGALMNLHCTAQTKAGLRSLSARRGEAVIKNEMVEVKAGESPTWSVP